MDDTVKAMRNESINTSEEANRVLLKAADTNLDDQDKANLDNMRAKGNVPMEQDRKVTISQGSRDPTSQTYGNRRAPGLSGDQNTPDDSNSDTGYSF